MNRINPLYVLLIVCITTLLSFYYLNNKKYNYLEENEKFRVFKQDSFEYMSLKNGWFNETKTKEDINSLVSDRKFRKSNIVRSFENSLATIKLVSNNKQTINYFISHLMQKEFRIKSFYITNKLVKVEVFLK